MKRREFFQLGARKTAETALDLLGERARRRAENWLRPPYALAELEFLLTCTRCDACVEACPHDVVFKLPARLGLEVVAGSRDTRERGRKRTAVLLYVLFF